jgi:hypothetical protein
MLIALSGLAAAQAVPDAARANRTPMLNITVKPRSGSVTTRFVISFRAAETTGRIGSVHRMYRITASGRGRGGCQASAVAQATPSRAGAMVHVLLAPARSNAWCAGTFRGQVWEALRPACPVGKACPAIVPLPRMVGKFTFRVSRG